MVKYKKHGYDFKLRLVKEYQGVYSSKGKQSFLDGSSYQIWASYIKNTFCGGTEGSYIK